MREHKIMKKIIAIITACVMMLTPIASYGYIRSAKEPSETGKSMAELNGYTEEEWARLIDDNLEYGEIKELIHLFNPNMDNGWNQMDDNARDMQQSVFVLNDARKKTKETYDDSVKQIRLLPIPEEMKQAEIKKLDSLKILEQTVGTAAHQYNENYKKMRSTSSMTRGLYSAEDSLTYAVQSLMVAYSTVHANVGMLQKLVELYTKQLDSYKSLMTQGMATETDVLKAQSDLVSSQSNLAKLKTTDQQLYNQIITMCGWKSGDRVNIGSIPVPDASEVAGMNPEADAEVAANNNSQIKALHSAKHKNTSAGLDVYFGKEAELKGYVRANMQKVYADVIAAQQGYEAAQVGLEAAKLNKKAVDTQYRQGLLSEPQYLGASIEKVQKDAAYTGALNSYVQAILDYKAALRGNIDAN